MPRALWSIAVLVVLLAPAHAQAQTPTESKPLPEGRDQRDARMKWWREARFGLFIHWGLYAVPAGQWQDKTTHGEWIMHTARIPVEQYERFRAEFNPVQFNAQEWVRLARDAGMKYIVITSKHHDGFCLFDSQHTDYDIMSTPFRRDVMKELAEASRQAGLHICWYHSIMDWHHPDYLPRREWDTRPTAGADFERYCVHLKNQLRELVGNYGPIGVLWFDGEWEESWNHERGVELYNFVRGLQPDIIINNRVDKGRAGMQGMTTDERFAGDFGTPEQEIPPTGLPGVDWETCMTMNDHWGYNRRDQNWKSSTDLVRKLADIASKGGNFLLNVGPTADGVFPPACIERLHDIGQWMKVNGASIYGTQASPFKLLPWGRCTQKPLDNGRTRLYLHVFDWPADGRLTVSGLLNDARQAVLLAGTDQPALPVAREGDALVIRVPPTAPDPVDTVVALDVDGRPDVTVPPVIRAPAPIFLEHLDVTISTDRENVELRYTTDGSSPTAGSPLVTGPVRLTQTATLQARAFRGDRVVSDVAAASFTRVTPRPAVTADTLVPGVCYEYFEGDWDRLPDFDRLTPLASGVLSSFDLTPHQHPDHFAFRYRGFVAVPRAGVYSFYTASDDGSRLCIGDTLVADNDGLHGGDEKGGFVALAAGAHPIIVTYFEKSGDQRLEVSYEGPGLTKQPIPASALSRPKP